MDSESRVKYAVSPVKSSLDELRKEVQILQKFSNDQSVPQVVRTLCFNKLSRQWTKLQQEMLKGKNVTRR